jgi:hypothetical protein
MKRILRECLEVALININILSADDIMNYVHQICGVRNRRMLLKNSFANHREALNHLYKCHNCHGFCHSVGDNLRTLFKGLYRSLAKQKRGGNARRGMVASILASDDGFAGMSSRPITVDSPIQPIWVPAESGAHQVSFAPNDTSQIYKS